MIVPVVRKYEAGEFIGSYDGWKWAQTLVILMLTDVKSFWIYTSKNDYGTTLTEELFLLSRAVCSWPTVINEYKNQQAMLN